MSERPGSGLVEGNSVTGDHHQQDGVRHHEIGQVDLLILERPNQLVRQIDEGKRRVTANGQIQISGTFVATGEGAEENDEPGLILFGNGADCLSYRVDRRNGRG